jgi:hypothetical protein
LFYKMNKKILFFWKWTLTGHWVLQSFVLLNRSELFSFSIQFSGPFWYVYFNKYRRMFTRGKWSCSNPSVTFLLFFRFLTLELWIAEDSETSSFMMKAFLTTTSCFSLVSRLTARLKCPSVVIYKKKNFSSKLKKA